MLTTQQLAAKHGVTGAYIRKLLKQKRLKPLHTLPSGQHLWRDGQQMPKKRKTGPRSAAK